MARGERTRIKIVPHFMRFHEWTALEERHYEAEGLEPELLADVMHRVSAHRGDPYKARPQDRPFVDPEIPIADARGVRKLATGELKTLFWVAAELDVSVLEAYFRALRRADAALHADPERYLPLWARNVPPELAGDHDYRTFGLGELLFFEPYPRTEFADAVAFADTWGLTGHMRDRRYEHLATPVSL